MFVLELRTDFRLTGKTRACHQVVGKVGANNLDRDLALESGGILVGAVDFAHATGVDTLDQVVVAEAPACLVLFLIYQAFLLFHRLSASNLHTLYRTHAIHIDVQTLIKFKATPVEESVTGRNAYNLPARRTV